MLYMGSMVGDEQCLVLWYVIVDLEHILVKESGTLFDSS